MTNWFTGLMRSSTGFWATVVVAGTVGVATGTLLATEPAIILNATATESASADSTGGGSVAERGSGDGDTTAPDGTTSTREQDGAPRTLLDGAPRIVDLGDGSPDVPRTTSTSNAVTPRSTGSAVRSGSPAAGPTAAGGPAVTSPTRSWVLPGSPGRAPGTTTGSPGSNGTPPITRPVVPPVITEPPVTVPPIVPPITTPPTTPPPTDPPTTPPPTDPPPTQPGPGDGGTGESGEGGSGNGDSGQDTPDGDTGQTVSPQSTED